MYHIANVVSELLVHERCTDHDDLKTFIKMSVNG